MNLDFIEDYKSRLKLIFVLLILFPVVQGCEINYGFPNSFFMYKIYQNGFTTNFFATNLVLDILFLSLLYFLSVKFIMNLNTETVEKVNSGLFTLMNFLLVIDFLGILAFLFSRVYAVLQFFYLMTKFVPSIVYTILLCVFSFIPGYLSSENYKRRYLYLAGFILIIFAVNGGIFYLFA